LSAASGEPGPLQIRRFSDSDTNVGRAKRNDLVQSREMSWIWILHNGHRD